MVVIRVIMRIICVVVGDGRVIQRLLMLLRLLHLMLLFLLLVLNLVFVLPVTLRGLLKLGAQMRRVNLIKHVAIRVMMVMLLLMMMLLLLLMMLRLLVLLLALKRFALGF